MGKLVETLAKELNIQLNGPLLSSIKKSNTPASRVYNWNVLSEVLIYFIVRVLPKSESFCQNKHKSKLHLAILSN